MSHVETVETVEPNGKIACAICGELTHFVQKHLKDAHPGVSLEDYKAAHPTAPLYSPSGKALVEKALREKAAKTAATPSSSALTVGFETGLMHEVFGLGDAPAARNKRTNAGLPITVLLPEAQLRAFVPDKDPNYIFPIDLLKVYLMGIEMNMNCLAWGHAGTGKSTLFEQIAAHTGRPMIRIQHTRNTEESHIVGQWTVRNGETVFELGPLAFAMKHGLAYLADEYDFGMPSVLSVYQPVMEGKPLVIKEADAENRIVRPHPNFRFLATGNTNGTGDDSGLYQGTMIQNAANYERFHVTEEIPYMEAKMEVKVIMAQARLGKEFAEKLVKFAQVCRESFASGKIGLPPSPRAMINAARLGKSQGSFEAGLRLSYINRLSRIDREAVNELMRRTPFE